MIWGYHYFRKHPHLKWWLGFWLASCLFCFREAGKPTCVRQPSQLYGKKTALKNAQNTSPKVTIVFQPSIFRCEVMLVSGKLAMFVLDAFFLRSWFFPQGGKKKQIQQRGILGRLPMVKGCDTQQLTRFKVAFQGHDNICKTSRYENSLQVSPPWKPSNQGERWPIG